MHRTASKGRVVSSRWRRSQTSAPASSSRHGAPRLRSLHPQQARVDAIPAHRRDVSSGQPGSTAPSFPVRRASSAHSGWYSTADRPPPSCRTCFRNSTKKGKWPSAVTGAAGSHSTWTRPAKVSRTTPPPRVPIAHPTGEPKASADSHSCSIIASLCANAMASQLPDLGLWLRRSTAFRWLQQPIGRHLMIDVVEQVIERHQEVKNEGISEEIDVYFLRSRAGAQV